MAQILVKSVRQLSLEGLQFPDRLTRAFLVLTPHRHRAQSHSVVTTASRQHPGLTLWNPLSQISPFPGDLYGSVCGLCSTCQSHELVVTEQIMETFCQLSIVWIVEGLQCHRSAEVPLDLDQLVSFITAVALVVIDRVLELAKAGDNGRTGYHVHHRALRRGLCSGGDDLGMTVAKVRHRVHGQKVDVLLPVDVPCFGSLRPDEGYLGSVLVSALLSKAAGQDQRQRGRHTGYGAKPPAT